MDPIQIFSNSIIENHLISKQGFLSSLAKISRRDYNGKDYSLPDNTKALDIDAYEKKIHKDNPKKTIDAAIGIAQYSNGTLSNERLLLIELRMGFTGTGNNSKTSDMKDKENNTRSLLYESKIDKRCYFIFKKDVAELRKSIHNRESIADKSISHWHIVTPEQFLNEFHENPPEYQIITPVDKIISDINAKIKNRDYDYILSTIDYWLKKEDSYYHKHIMIECHAIYKMVEKILEKIHPFIEDLPDKTQFDFLLCEERVEEISTHFH